MSTPPVIALLSSSPNVPQTFWYSRGTALPQGHLLTVNTFWSNFINVAVGGLVAWSLSRLWRITCALVFRVTFRERLSWEEGQNVALLVNSKSALEAGIDATQLITARRKILKTSWKNKATITAITVVVIALLVVCLTLTFPLLVALIPVAKQGLVAPVGECTGLALGTEVPLPPNVTIKFSRLANAAFSWYDLYGTNKDNNSSPKSSSVPAAYPQMSVSYTTTCPPNATACSSVFPFTFSSDYTLLPRHFGLNIDTPFALQVHDTCYRPIAANSSLDGGGLGLYYGAVNYTTGLYTAYTDPTVRVVLGTSGYFLYQYTARANSPNSGSWTPNSTLLLGGDTTILLYTTSAVGMLNRSSDPLFATDNVMPPANFSFGLMYSSLDPSVPIICDTKYTFCGHDAGDCSVTGGAQNVWDWLDRKDGNSWEELRQFFGVSLASPPIHQASFGSLAVYASQTTLDNIYQMAPNDISALKELTRLSEAGMLMQASYAQLSTVGYFDLHNQSVDRALTLDPSSPHSVCKNIVMQSPGVVTMPVLSYAVLLAILFFTSLASYVKYLPRRVRFSSLDYWLDAWLLYTPGQLYREVTERVRGDFTYVGSKDLWPTVATHHLGPEVVIINNRKRLGSRTDSGQDLSKVEVT
jgi:hypothetical protein